MQKVIIMLLLTTTLFATDKYDSIFINAGKLTGVPPKLLKSIAKIESNLDPNCITYNKNGTIDYGIMQINTIHIKELQKLGVEVNERNIMNPELNIYIGAYILQKVIKHYGYNPESIGRYHSNTPKYKKIWLSKLTRVLIKEI